ncbi:Ibd2p KNAG_0F01400 [Huiozyma naganishii CBS 8797]|uniref:Protein IBD2 n=1 Tax=Huiozyma naganishii (strain ATCC MYA-139 / BCRC 22969 / CBS 8797 / KCTC 17520 / NBRC 10181 / NCYC 3082 / Yp74L-3) TaxID=1071383 RepID=J7RML2_HUIN7|nr:hypothetical protein KNAG_0F01400 [Kazachstania naganishii CBS 8797]CCK70808.1 hypothetical protein KNAG_0F01400 [Kazachstania naganishii CBS 8797]
MSVSKSGNLPQKRDGHGNNLGNNTSIELVSKNGPLPINVMMQEGVKALTKILSNQLQDRKAFENSQHSMQFVLKNDSAVSNGSGNQQIANHSRIGPNSTIIDHTRVDEPDGMTDSSMHIGEDQFQGSQRNSDAIFGGQVQNFIDDEFENPDIQFDGDEADIIFDYETQELPDNVDGIGKKISEMIESVLPGGFTTDSAGKLHAVMNGNELNITELNDDNVDGEIEDMEELLAKHRESLQLEAGKDRPSGLMHSIYNGGDVTHGGNGEGHEDEDAEDAEEEENGGGAHYDHGSCCPYHQNSNERSSKFKNYHYHEFDYITPNKSITSRSLVPDFSILANQDKPMCTFCEYYMVFGEPPKNMIKWYNNTYGYNRVPMSSQQREQHNRRYRQQQHGQDQGKHPG